MQPYPGRGLGGYPQGIQHEWRRGTFNRVWNHLLQEAKCYWNKVLMSLTCNLRRAPWVTSMPATDKGDRRQYWSLPYCIWRLRLQIYAASRPKLHTLRFIVEKWIVFQSPDKRASKGEHYIRNIIRHSQVEMTYLQVSPGFCYVQTLTPSAFVQHISLLNMHCWASIMGPVTQTFSQWQI